MATFAPYYHVGIVVPEVPTAMDLLGRQLGVRWGPILHLDASEYRDGEGEDLVLPTTICYSVDEPRLELIEEVPGTVWVRNDHSNLHHIGFWGELTGDSGALAGGGCPLQLCGRSGETAPVSFAYHGHELGIRIEIVDSAMRDAMDFLFHPGGS